MGTSRVRHGSVPGVLAWVAVFTGLVLGKPLLLAILAAPALWAQAARTDVSRTNVVLIMVDDLSYGCIAANGGTSFETPNIDNLARDGMRFTQCYSQPLCTPSRVKLMTGKYNWRNYMTFSRLKPGERTFAHLMQEAGYATAMTGKWQLWGGPPREPFPSGMKPGETGFDEYLYQGYLDLMTEAERERYFSESPPGQADGRFWHPLVFNKSGYVHTTSADYGPDMYADFAINFIKRNKDGPFFLYWPMALIHAPLVATPKSETITDATKFSYNREYFADMVAYTDHLIGRLVTTLDDLGIEDETLLLLTADNGTSRHLEYRVGERVVQGGKGRTTDAGTRVPLFARWTGTVAPGSVNDNLIDFSDFYATLADLTGQSLADEFDGHSFLPQLRGQASSPREWLFVHHDHRPEERNEAIRFARTRRYKLYGDGRFYDVPDDWEEQSPLTDLTPEATKVRAKLQDVLDSMPPAAPGAPTQLRAVAEGTDRIYLSWEVPANTGNAAIGGYRIEVAGGGNGWRDLVENTHSSATNYTHSGLAAGVKWRYRVSAINSADTGPASNKAIATVGVPGAPRDLQVTAAGSIGFILLWKAPANTGAAAVRGYRIAVSPDGDDWNTLVRDSKSAGTAYVHIGLAAGTTKHYRVSAINSAGTGPSSAPVSATTRAAVAAAEFARSLEPSFVGEGTGRAKQGADYTPASGKLAFQPVETAKAVEAATVEDKLGVADATFALALGETTNVTVRNVRQSAPGTIHHDDYAAENWHGSPAGIAIWTDELGYRPGERLRLYRAMEPMGDESDYSVFFYRENIETGERRYLAPAIRPAALREEAVDQHGRGERDFWVGPVRAVQRELIWEGAVPEPGLWHFVAELRGPEARTVVKRAHAKFVVARGNEALNRGGSERAVTDELTLHRDTLYSLQNRLVVRPGAMLAVEAGTLVRARGPRAEIVVEPGGRIEVRGRQDAPVVMTCAAPVGRREPGCWGGLRVLGLAPVEARRGGPVAMEGREAFGGDDPHDSSGSLRYLRVEFAGGGPAGAALALDGVGGGTRIEHVQVHASVGDGIAFRGGTAECAYCVASEARKDALDWAQGWRGKAWHVYVQQGPDSGSAMRASGPGLSPAEAVPSLSNVTLVGAFSAEHLSGRVALRPQLGRPAIRLEDGAALAARNALVVGFAGPAIEARTGAVAQFVGGRSSFTHAILYANRPFRNPRAQITDGISAYVEYLDDDPDLLNIRYEANPDPRPRNGSAALRSASVAVPSDGIAPSPTPHYVGAFGRRNWLEEWTFFGDERDYDPAVESRQR